jgi:hypothetical protein
MDEAAWRAGMVAWLEQYGTAIEAVRADVRAAKAARANAAHLAQQAFVPMGGRTLQDMAHNLRGHVTLRSTWLSTWRAANEGRSDATHDIGAIESFADSFFTLCTLDDETYHAQADLLGIELPLNVPVNVPWLVAEPSPRISHASIVHRGPINGGHVKLYLRAGGTAGTVFAIDFTKASSRVRDHDWGAATALSRAGYAYPRSGEMYPTIFRFLPADEADVPEFLLEAPEPRDQLRPRDAIDETGVPRGQFRPRDAIDETGVARDHWCSPPERCGHATRDVVAGCGWFALEGATVRTAYSTFVALASRRWAHVELYNCRSFVREMLLELKADDASVQQMLTRTFCAVAQMHDPFGPTVAGNPWANAWFRSEAIAAKIRSTPPTK